MRRGVIPGLIAGHVFLAYIGPGMLDAIGAAFSGTAAVGFIAHGIVSAVLGALYTEAFMRRLYLFNPILNIMVGGFFYGLILWIIGGNIIFPLLAGGNVLELYIGASFYGHIIFGNTLAFLVYLLYMALGLEHEYMMGRERQKSHKHKYRG